MTATEVSSHDDSIPRIVIDCILEYKKSRLKFNSRGWNTFKVFKTWKVYIILVVFGLKQEHLTTLQVNGCHNIPFKR